MSVRGALTLDLWAWYVVATPVIASALSVLGWIAATVTKR